MADIVIGVLDWVLRFLWTVVGLAGAGIVIVVLWRIASVVNEVGEYFKSRVAFKIAKVYKAAEIKGYDLDKMKYKSPEKILPIDEPDEIEAVLAEAESKKKPEEKKK